MMHSPAVAALLLAVSAGSGLAASSIVRASVESISSGRVAASDSHSPASDSLAGPTNLASAGPHADLFQTAAVGQVAIATWFVSPLQEVHGLLFTRDGRRLNDHLIKVSVGGGYALTRLDDGFAIVWLERDETKSLERIVMQKISLSGEMGAAQPLLTEEARFGPFAAHWNGADLAIAWSRGSSMNIARFAMDGSPVGEWRTLDLGRNFIAPAPSFLEHSTSHVLVWGRGVHCPIGCPYILATRRIDELDQDSPPIEVPVEGYTSLIQRAGTAYVMIEDKGWVTEATRVDASGTVVQRFELDPLIKTVPASFVPHDQSLILASNWNRDVVASINPNSLEVEWIASAPERGWHDVKLPWPDRIVWLASAAAGESLLLHTARVSPLEMHDDLSVEVTLLSREDDHRRASILVSNLGQFEARNVRLSIGSEVTIEALNGAVPAGEYGEVEIGSLGPGEAHEIVVQQPLYISHHWTGERMLRLAFFDSLRVAVSSPAGDRFAANNAAQLPPPPGRRRGVRRP